MQFAQYTLPDFCRFSSGISPEIRSANVCVSIFSQIYLVFLISGVKKAHRFRHFRQSPPLSGFFPVFRPPSRLFPQGSCGMLRQRQPPLLMRPLHCAFQPGDSHASDVGHWLGMAPGRGDYRRLRVIPSQRARWRGNPLLNGTGERCPPMPCS